MLSDGKIGFRFGSWATAPSSPEYALPCDPFFLDEWYSRYARRTTQPTRPTDEITVFVTEYRRAGSTCPYVGAAVLGGNILHLNGLQYRADRIPPGKHLQHWVLAHELGHAMGLAHSDLRWSRAAVARTFDPRDRVAAYGDHLDLMGRPDNLYYRPAAD